MAKRPTKKRAVDPGDERSHRDVVDGDYALVSPSPSPAPIAAAPVLSPAEIVEAGARWLDRHAPGWADSIDPDTININDPAHDPLALAFGGGPWSRTDGLRLLMECQEVSRKDKYTGQAITTWIPKHPERIYDFGFFARPDAVPENPGGFPYVDLNRAWKWAILARREGIS